MKNLIFVGGLQYSGKSTFCGQLERQGNGRYLHINSDDVHTYLAEHKDVFMGLIRRYDERLYNATKILGRQEGTEDDARCIDLLVNLATKTGKLDNFRNIHDTCGLIYVADWLGRLHDDTSPVAEGLMSTKESRQIIYKILKDNLANNKLDAVKKLFVYFNLGLDISLKRFREHGGQKREMTTYESTIIKTYSEQKIPTADELPNLDVLMITDEKQIGSAIAYIRGKF